MGWFKKPKKVESITFTDAMRAILRLCGVGDEIDSFSRIGLLASIEMQSEKEADKLRTMFLSGTVPDTAPPMRGTFGHDLIQWYVAQRFEGGAVLLEARYRAEPYMPDSGIKLRELDSDYFSSLEVFVKEWADCS